MTAWRRFAAMAAVAAVAVAGCSRFESTMETDEFTQPEPTSTRADWLAPYGPGWEHLAGEPPETVATQALERLCSFTPVEYDEASAFRRLDGVVTPQLWRQMRHDPRSVIALVPMTQWQHWEQAGGGQAVTVTVDDELHPADTDRTWQRKMSCLRTMDGFDEEFVDGYTVGVTNTGGQWRVSELLYLGTTFHTDEEKTNGIER